jgi:hypothetical protein
MISVLRFVLVISIAVGAITGERPNRRLCHRAQKTECVQFFFTFCKGEVLSPSRVAASR